MASTQFYAITDLAFAGGEVDHRDVSVTGISWG
jgi:hypothetical protein